MRVDGGKSVQVWAKRLASFLDDMEKDGVSIECGSPVKLHKDGEQRSIAVDSDKAAWL